MSPDNDEATSPRKRKRTTSSSLETQQNHIRLKTDLPSRPIASKGHGTMSPKQSVSSKMGRLAIKDATVRSILPKISAADDVHATTHNKAEPATAEDSNVVPFKRLPLSVPSFASSHRSETTPRKAATRLPKTPDLRPVPSPAAGPTVSPLADTTTAAHDLSALDQSPTPQTSTESNEEQRISSPSASLGQVSGPRGRGIAPSGHVAKSRRRNSPPPSSATEVSDLVWSDAEITGHDPDDPDDDLYGINGIGFRPTPAMAEQRRAQRRRQIADWRKREDNERRAHRRQTRHLDGPAAESTEADEEGKKVRFLEQTEI